MDGSTVDRIEQKQARERKEERMDRRNMEHMLTARENRAMAEAARDMAVDIAELWVVQNAAGRMVRDVLDIEASPAAWEGAYENTALALGRHLLSLVERELAAMADGAPE
jgi:hypothetical protein